MIYPELKDCIPWIPLGNLPTPLEELGSSIGLTKDTLFVKRDDLSSTLYGGNKVRKLEYLFAEALLQNRDEIISIGSIGSNHALTTAILGASLDFQVELCLFNQALSEHVKENLQGMLAAGAKLHYTKDMPGAYQMARRQYKKLKEAGKRPYFIISGATCGLGNFGYCTAMYELKHQIENGEMPMPGSIFVPVGTCGTIAGLLAGIKLTGLPIKVFGVKVFDSFPANKYMIKYYAQNVLNYIQKQRNTIKLHIENDDFELLEAYLGDGYGIPTIESIRAVKQLEPRLKLETTYTGKTFAACMEYCKSEAAKKPVLFWNTYNSQPFPMDTGLEDLPEELEFVFS